MAFIAGGYTPAKAAPVMNRAVSAMGYESVTTIDAFAAPASALPNSSSRRGGIRSARLVADDNTAPATKPSCTTIVNQLAALVLSSQRSRSCPRTAAVENHGDMAATRDAARISSCFLWSAIAAYACGASRRRIAAGSSPTIMSTPARTISST